MPCDIDLAKTVSDELKQLQAVFPQRKIELSARGDNRGRFDAARMQQVIRNLVFNAIRHGWLDSPVHVSLVGEQAAEVCVDVSNSGKPIDPSEIEQLFDPLRRGVSPHRSASGAATDGLGLGLFIVREIVKAHDGQIEARCQDHQTTFAIRLPRRETN